MGFGEITPKFGNDLGYLALLDTIIKFANGYLIEKQYSEYYRTLESWYLETIFRFRLQATRKVSNEKMIDDEDLEELEKIRAAASSLQEIPLKKYHEKLNELTHKAQLRLRDNDTMLGIHASG